MIPTNSVGVGKIGYTTHRHGDRNIRYTVLNRSRIYIESSKRVLDTNNSNHTILLLPLTLVTVLLRSYHMFPFQYNSKFMGANF